MKNRSFVIACFALLCTVLAGQATAQSPVPSTTAMKDGRFHVDVRGVIGRSDIVLGRPNLLSEEAMPLGNGRLGVAVWSADGLTAQLNRADTMPSRLSTGQVVIPGIAALTSAKNYAGRLDLFNGEFREQGGGMSVTAYVEPGTDTLDRQRDGSEPQPNANGAAEAMGAPSTANCRAWQGWTAVPFLAGQQIPGVVWVGLSDRFRPSPRMAATLPRL